MGARSVTSLPSSSLPPSQVRLNGRFETRESTSPKRIELASKCLHARGVGAIEAPLALSALEQEPRVDEYANVLRHGGATYGERVRQLTGGQFVREDEVHDRAPRWMGECRQLRVERRHRSAWHRH